MSKPVIVDDEVYELLSGIKRAMSRHASFNSLIKELVRVSAGSLSTETKFQKETRAHFQKVKIWKFIRDLQDNDLISSSMSEVDILVPLVFLINGQWIELAELTGEKARFVKQSLEQYSENLEVVRSAQMKNISNKSTNGKEPSTVGSVKNTTSPGQKSAKSTQSTKGQKKKPRKHSK